ncbi:MAG: hypothetical protein KF819_24970 [Labilithrix sp.]|nr:hypothetical protein [Labilithrix sp.]
MAVRFLPILLFALAHGAAGCAINLPEKVALLPEAANVEIITEPPNKDVYEPAGEVSAQVIGRESQDAMRQAFNQLRNQAASKNASFVAIDDVTAHAAWDFSGRTVVTLVGTAYRPK